MFAFDGLANFCDARALEGYRLMFNIEAYLRHMLRWELVGAYGKDWRGALGAVNAEAERLMAEEASLRIIDADRRNILAFTLLSDLRAMMTADALWPLFKDHWPPKEMFETEFRLLNALRHKSAHLRRLTDRDMRALDRARDIVESSTRHYRTKLRAIGTVSEASDKAVPETFAAALGEWIADGTQPDGRWSNVLLRRLSKYLVVDARLRTGGFSPGAVARLVDGLRADPVFLYLDEASGRLRAYLPTCLAAPFAARLIGALRDLQGADDTGLGAVDDELEHFDFVFPIEVELPIGFRV